MDELEKLRKHWQDDDFQRKHALAREIVVNRLRELNREYEEKTGQGFVRFIETRMKTPESIAEKLQRKDYDVDFDTAVTALNDISGVRCICYSVKEIYWIARQIGKTDTYTAVSYTHLDVYKRQVIGSLQAMEAIKYLIGVGDLLTGKLLTFDALKMEFHTIKLPKADHKCAICGDHPTITELIDYEQIECPDH